MDKNLFDNISVHELEEMIHNEEITLDELDNSALEKILNYETDMLCLGTGDMAIIQRCSELLNERNDSETLNKDKVVSIINKAKNDRVIIIDEESNKSKVRVIGKRPKILRRVALVAAIITLMLATTTLVAAAFGVNIFEYLSEIVRQDEGTQIVVDDFTFYHNGEVKQYSSIEDMIKSEDFDVMFPKKFPEGINVVKVTLNESVQGNDAIHIATNDNNTYIFIEINGNEPNGSHPDSVAYEIDGAIYYIFQENNTFFASCYYDNCHYSIQAESYDNLIFIIDNMKE